MGLHNIIPKGVVQKPSFNNMAYLQVVGMSFLQSVHHNSLYTCTNISGSRNRVLNMIVVFTGDTLV